MKRKKRNKGKISASTKISTVGHSNGINDFKSVEHRDRKEADLDLS